MKLLIFVAQPHVVAGNLKENYKNILHYISLAQEAKASYIIFPKETLTGENLGALNDQMDFRNDAAKLRLNLQKINNTNLKIIFSDDYDMCGCHINPQYVGISYLGKNIQVHFGGSAAYNADGKIAAQAKYFTEDFLIIIFDTETQNFIEKNNSKENFDKIKFIYHTLHFGVKEFLKQKNIQKMTVGLSGGIDSAVAAALFVDILGPENVLLINMPTKFNSDLTKSLAQNIAKKLNTKFLTVPIDNVVEKTLETLKNYNFEASQIIFENIQARDRSSRILAAFSAAFGGAFSANSNKAELCVGYTTFYGDLAGALAPLGDLWKYQVYELGKYLNNYVFKKEVIPNAVFQIRPSAELSEMQTIGKGGDPLYYPYHDFLFNAFTKNISLTKIAKWYQEGILEEKIGCRSGILNTLFKNNHKNFFDDLERWYKLYHGLAIAKRLQAPPIIIISSNPFLLPEPQISAYFSEEYLKIKISLLN